MKQKAFKFILLALLIIAVSNAEISQSRKFIQSFDEMRLSNAKQATPAQAKAVHQVFADMKSWFTKNKAVSLKYSSKKKSE
jgi:hypothetical protein